MKSAEQTSIILSYLESLYGDKAAQLVFLLLKNIMERYILNIPSSIKIAFDEKDSILIIYGDGIYEENVPALSTLHDFCQRYILKNINSIHILPFYPSSSDDGFSVIDYKSVDSILGNWGHIENLDIDYKLMFDAVINHVSVQSEWFNRFLQEKQRYEYYFIIVDNSEGLAKVTRPRNNALLTPFATTSGNKYVWTTFSSDQVDLNYKNPDVLLAIIDVLLFYVSKGAEYIRLDAVAYLWKKLSTTCIHLEETHKIIQLFRAVLKEVAPHVKIITETNVPHEDNISYYGDGDNEAHMVYNFTLPPLVLYTFYAENTRKLSEWAQTLYLPSNSCTYLNFLAAHDGIGLTPLYGLVDDAIIQSMCDRVKNLGGYVSYKVNSNGTEIPYELNINYLDALGNTDMNEEDVDVVAKRFLVSQAIMLAIRGIPGIYYHSLLGSKGWKDGVKRTGRVRTINREKINLPGLENELNDSYTLRYKVFYTFLNLIKKRTSEKAFHPNGGQRIIQCNDAVFILLRSSLQDDEHILCFHNVTNMHQDIQLNCSDMPILKSNYMKDLINGSIVHIDNDNDIVIVMKPFQIMWLKSIAYSQDV